MKSKERKSSSESAIEKGIDNIDDLYIILDCFYS